MKKTFQAYYRPSEEEFKRLWTNCIFVPDTNMLLNIYRYTDNTRKELIGILERISSQLWIPYQVGFEYQRRRPEVILEQEKVYDDYKIMFEEILATIEKRLNISQSHPSISKSAIIRKIKATLSSVNKGLNKQKSQHPKLLDIDPLRDKLTDLFLSKVGERFQNEKLVELYKKGEERYKKRIPPGYMDEKKEGDQKYGDLIIWFEMIEKAKKIKKPIVFITDDEKEDWWFCIKGKRIGPRPELIEEMLGEAGQSFYMYRIERFMEYSTAYLKRRVDKDAIKEVSAVRKERENLIEDILSASIYDVLLSDEEISKEKVTSRTIEKLLSSYKSQAKTGSWASMEDKYLKYILYNSAKNKTEKMIDSQINKILADYLNSYLKNTLDNMNKKHALQSDQEKDIQDESLRNQSSNKEEDEK